MPSLRSRLARPCMIAVWARSGITLGRRFSRVMLMQSPAAARRISGSTGTPGFNLPVIGSRSPLRTYRIAVGSCSGPLCPPMVKISPSSGSVIVTCGMLTGREFSTRVPPAGFSGPPTCWPRPAGSAIDRPSGLLRMSLASAATTS
ncbi:hypothetical protein D3C72_691880 [compost metagenome]